MICPSCGIEIYGKGKEEYEKELLICEECGAEIPSGEPSCPVCGCPVNVNESYSEEKPQKVELSGVNLPKLDQKKRNIFISIIAVIVIAAIVSVVSINNSKNKYKNNLVLVTKMMLDGASFAEDAGGLVHDVWYNTIFEEFDYSTTKYTTKSNGVYYDDFNDALLVLFSDPDFKSKIDALEDNQELVKELMKELTNPSKEYTEAYDALKDYYDTYLELTNLVISPSGNLQTFTSDFNNADSDLLKYYKAMEMYID